MLIVIAVQSLFSADLCRKIVIAGEVFISDKGHWETSFGPRDNRQGGTLYVGDYKKTIDGNWAKLPPDRDGDSLMDASSPVVVENKGAESSVSFKRFGVFQTSGPGYEFGALSVRQSVTGTWSYSLNDDEVVKNIIITMFAGGRTYARGPGVLGSAEAELTAEGSFLQPSGLHENGQSDSPPGSISWVTIPGVRIYGIPVPIPIPNALPPIDEDIIDKSEHYRFPRGGPFVPNEEYGFDFTSKVLSRADPLLININGGASSSLRRLGMSISLETELKNNINIPRVDNVPEIDPAGMGSVLALVTGAMGLLERRRLRVA